MPSHVPDTDMGLGLGLGLILLENTGIRVVNTGASS